MNVNIILRCADDSQDVKEEARRLSVSGFLFHRFTYIMYAGATNSRIFVLCHQFHFVLCYMHFNVYVRGVGMV